MLQFMRLQGVGHNLVTEKQQPKIYQQIIQHHIKTANNPISKDGQQAHEKMLNITIHQGKPNQNHSDITSHLIE